MQKIAQASTTSGTLWQKLKQAPLWVLAAIGLYSLGRMLYQSAKQPPHQQPKPSQKDQNLSSEHNDHISIPEIHVIPQFIPQGHHDTSSTDLVSETATHRERRKKAHNPQRLFTVADEHTTATGEVAGDFEKRMISEPNVHEEAEKNAVDERVEKLFYQIYRNINLGDSRESRESVQ